MRIKNTIFYEKRNSPEFSTTRPFILSDPSADTYTLPVFIPGNRTLVSPSFPQNTVGDGRPKTGTVKSQMFHPREFNRMLVFRYFPRTETFLWLKLHGNEADFLGFLQKLVPHRSLTLPFEPFRFWLQIRGDIRNRKTTPRLGESATPQLDESGSRRLSDSASRGVANSPTRQVGESLWNRYSIF
jgi:hypothetical protein